MCAGQFVDPGVAGQSAEQAGGKGGQDKLVPAAKDNEQRRSRFGSSFVGRPHQQGQAIQGVDRRTVQGEGIEIHPAQGLEIVAGDPVAGYG